MVDRCWFAESSQRSDGLVDRSPFESRNAIRIISPVKRKIVPIHDRRAQNATKMGNCEQSEGVRPHIPTRQINWWTFHIKCLSTLYVYHRCTGSRYSWTISLDYAWNFVLCIKHGRVYLKFHAQSIQIIPKLIRKPSIRWVFANSNDENDTICGSYSRILQCEQTALCIAMNQWLFVLLTNKRWKSCRIRARAHANESGWWWWEHCGLWSRGRGLSKPFCWRVQHDDGWGERILANACTHTHTYSDTRVLKMRVVSNSGMGLGWTRSENNENSDCFVCVSGR